MVGMRRWGGVVALAAVGMLAMEARASVAPMISDMRVKAGANAQLSLTLDLPGTLSDDAQVSTTSGPNSFYYQNVASSEVSGGLAPQAIATAASTFTTTFASSNSFEYAGRRSSARAELSYTVSYAAREAPPSDFDPYSHPLPLKAQWSVDASITGEVEETTNLNFLTGNYCSFSLQMGHFTLSAALTPEYPTYNAGGLVTVLMTTAGSLNVRMIADVRAEAWQKSPGLGKTTGIESQIVVDPVFSFDQEAFDAFALEGEFESFDLNRYFELVYSPNLVPEPTGMLPLGLLALTLTSRRYRRCVSR
jgi:hypothetical protein